MVDNSGDSNKLRDATVVTEKADKNSKETISKRPIYWPKVTQKRKGVRKARRHENSKEEVDK